MPYRDIIEIDEELCDGCGLCISACAEGALELVDGVARLTREDYCDGLGACLGDCPQGAITVVRREAPAFIEPPGHAPAPSPLQPPTHAPTTIPVQPLAAPGAPLAVQAPPAPAGSGCPGSRAATLLPSVGAAAPVLSQWPVQLHLLPPTAPFLAGRPLLLAADCAGFASGELHARFLEGRALAIACPKLDSNQEIYLEKLVAMIDDGGITGLDVLVMEVPCCAGLARLAQAAAARAQRQVPVTLTILGIRGNVLGQQRVA